MSDLNLALPGTSELHMKPTEWKFCCVSFSMRTTTLSHDQSFETLVYMRIYICCTEYRAISSTFREIDPDTTYVVCIYPYHLVFLIWYPHSIVFLILYPYALFPYTVIQPIALGVALLWSAMDFPLSQGPLLWRHNNMTLIVPRNTRGRERDTRQRLDNANLRRLQTFSR